MGTRLEVDGRVAKVKRVEPSGEVRVRYGEDGSKDTLWLPADNRRVSNVRPPKRKREDGGGDDDDDDEEVESQAAAAAAREPTPLAATSRIAELEAELSALKSAAVHFPTAAQPAATALSGAPPCTHCGRPGCTPRACTFGLESDERFLLCKGSASAVGCFTRTFLVPLRRASPAFDCDALRTGRVDVGLRCVSSALFRSQSLRQNTRVILCFLGDAEAASGGTGGGKGSGKSGGKGGGSDDSPSGGGAAAACGEARIVEVCGALVRDLRPDERSLALRLRAVSEADGAAEAEARVAAARRAARADPSVAPAEDGPVGVWSRGETRGLSSTGESHRGPPRAAPDCHVAHAPKANCHVALLRPS